MFGYFISLVTAQDFDHSNDAGFQGVPGIRRVHSLIPNYLRPTGSGVFVFVDWLSGTLTAGTIGSARGLGVSVGVVGRKLAIISCNALISQSY